MRWLIALLVFGAIVVAISGPQRERLIQDTAFVREPYYRWTAKNRVEEIAQRLQNTADRGGALPGRLSFRQYLARTEQDSARTLDPWGNPYYLKAEAFAIRVGSMGRDGKEGTEDDIISGLVTARK
ncbi:hypothetical protein BH24GEM2_BH24GEM2_18550 [soil metagenome]|jgi:hypothetical protein